MKRRAERVSNLIRQEISELLQEQVNDPRLSSLISITQVTTTDDLKQTKVFVSILGNKADKNEMLQGFKSASRFFRRELSRRLLLRQVPELSFHFDDSIERGSNILKLIEQVSSENAENEH
jgi:ribosome-binding factor A